MGISLYDLGAGMRPFSGKMPGQRWQPKSQKLTVGDEIAPISRTSFAADSTRSVVVAEGDDVRFTSGKVFKAASDAARLGFRVKNFRAVNTETAASGMNAARSTGDGSVQDVSIDSAAVIRKNSLYEDKHNVVTWQDGALTIYAKNNTGGIEGVREKVAITDDTRISFDNDGNASVVSGSAARTNGVLSTTGDGQILIRMTDANVETGNAATVLNLSSHGGSFAGGVGTTYLGAYTESTFTGGAGTSVFAGYFSDSHFLLGEGQGKFEGVFERSTVEGGDKANIFSGYFSESTINGGSGKNLYDGMFLNGSTVTGGAGNEKFKGRFIDSSVDGGGGDDEFGHSIDLNAPELLYSENGDPYRALSVDFLGTAITGGDGKNKFTGVMNGGSLTFGKGDDDISGVFTQASVATGAGNDNLRAMFSDSTQFDGGDGDDSFYLATAFANTVRMGEGRNSATLGFNPAEHNSVKEGNALGGDSSLVSTVWKTPEQNTKNLPGRQFGELGSNNVDASVGENTILVRNGESEQVAWVGTGMDSGSVADADATADSMQAEDPAPSGEKGEKGEESSAGGTGSLNPLFDPAPALAREGARNARSIIEGSLAELGDTGELSAEQRRKRAALKRYAAVSGEAPSEGVLAVNITTGMQDDIQLNALYRDPVKTSDRDWMRRVVRRSTGQGYRFDETAG